MSTTSKSNKYHNKNDSNQPAHRRNIITAAIANTIGTTRTTNKHKKATKLHQMQQQKTSIKPKNNQPVSLCINSKTTSEMTMQMILKIFIATETTSQTKQQLKTYKNKNTTIN
jgi:predicted transcriptional regulator YheO